MADTPSSVRERLVSELANDPDMGEIVAEFVDEMPAKMQSLLDCWRGQKFDELRRLAHQLKGSSGGYGFPQVGKAAGVLEHAINESAATGSEGSLEQIRASMDELIGLCRRVSRE